jgi:hypothetical protein
MTLPGLRAVTALALLLGLACAAAAAPAHAHETDPSIVVELRSVTPALPAGVTVQVVTSIAAQLIAENTTGTELAVLDRRGVPFLRIGSEGVLANLASPDWYLSNDPTGAAQVPARAQDPAADPEWARVSREPSWGWFDHRLHPEPLGAADTDVEDGVVSRWEVALRYADTDVAVRGVVARRPIRGAVTAMLLGEPEIAPGVSLALLPGPVPGLFLSSDRDDVVIVEGGRGEAFLRVRPDGVDVNIRSPVWADNAAARGHVPPAEVDPAAAPQWQQVADVPRFGWLEPRALPAQDPPEAVVRGDRVVTLGRWVVPVRVGDDVVRAAGVTTWQPLAARDGLPDGAPPESIPRPLLLLAGVAALLAAAALTARRARCRRPPD